MKLVILESAYHDLGHWILNFMTTLYDHKCTIMHVNILWSIWLYLNCIASADINDTAFNLTFPDDLQIKCPHTKFCGLEPAQRLDPVL